MLVIGIAGGTGSGKTTFTEAIVDIFGKDVTVIHHDNYYNVLDHLSYEERCKVNYDHPDSFDTKLMIEHIKMLKNGESVEEPVYDYTVHNRDKTKSIKLAPTEILII
ncbi:MAG: uridine kinase, partial [Oscillospiraceae bacterium]|nr:uridine kinase [Oscillospiraceae bacterium]